MSESAPLTDDAWPRFEARLRAYVGRRVEPQSVNDVIGDIMLKLVRNQAGLSAASNPTAWLKSRVQRGRAKLKSTLLRCCRVEVDGRGCVVGYARRRGGRSG